MGLEPPLSRWEEESGSSQATRARPRQPRAWSCIVGRVSMLSFAMLFSLPVLAEPEHFSLAEKLIFAALAITSGYLFWRRFGVVLDKILKSKKDSNFHLFPITRRVADFFWEVLCQAKVIRERPLPGLAHALVAWALASSRPRVSLAASTSTSPLPSPWPAQRASPDCSSAASSSARNGWAQRSPGNPASSPF
jgi:hypothetical protein